MQSFLSFSITLFVTFFVCPKKVTKEACYFLQVLLIADADWRCIAGWIVIVF